MNPVVFSHRTDNWSTPQYFFDKLNEKYDFTLDVCADPSNAKCDLFFTKEDDALRQDWSGHTCWCNPPYGHDLYLWVEKAVNESYKLGTTVVMLLPARTDTKWFHDLVLPHAKYIHFIKGRLKFGGSLNFAPFPSFYCEFSFLR